MLALLAQVDDSKLVEGDVPATHRNNTITHDVRAGVEPEDHLFLHCFFLNFAHGSNLHITLQWLFIFWSY